MSNTHTLQAFLTGKSFYIPVFQRDYAWTIDEVNDLFDDVRETMTTKTSHYLGTIVLAGKGGKFAIVDGQQRLSTLMLMVRALLAQLDANDPVRIADEICLLNTDKLPKLDFGRNQSFLADVFACRNPSPSTRGQRRLAEAYRHCCERARVIRGISSGDVYRWLNAIKQLEIIEFIEENVGRAIRIFQSLNDRGRALTAMDKAKALLVLYSNQFLKGALDDRINQAFGECFAAYDRIRDQASQSGYEIDFINRANFSEDDLLRYHYLAYNTSESLPEANDYYGSTQIVLNEFLKRILQRKQNDSKALGDFISDYIDDLEAFTKAFAKLVESTRSDRRLFVALIMQKLAARLYPLTVRLFQRDLLFDMITGTTTSIDLLHCLETVDLRVYKIRGTDPARDIGHLSHASRTAAAADVAARLREFLTRFMSDAWMETQLGGRMYRNGAVVPILLAFEQDAISQPYSLEYLVVLNQHEPTEEHILSQEPSYDCTTLGFADQTEFEDYKNRLGNLLLLTKTENARCGNSAVGIKMSQPNLYPASKFAGARLLAQKFYNNGVTYDKKAVQERTEELTRYAVSKWPLW